MANVMAAVFAWSCVAAVASALLMQGIALWAQHRTGRLSATRSRLDDWATMLRGFNQQDGRLAAADPWQHHRHRTGNPLSVPVWSLSGINQVRVWRAEWGGYTTKPRHLRAV